MLKMMHTNEIRDYLQRAPKKWHFNGARMVNNTRARLTWLASIAAGTLDERINRRAGIEDVWKPWHNPTWKAIARHGRKARRLSANSKAA